MNTSAKNHRHPGLWSLPSGKHTHNQPYAECTHEFEHQFKNESVNVVSADVSQKYQDIEQLHSVLQKASTQPVQSDKWITLIGQPSCSMARQIVENTLKNHNIPLHKVRWIRSKNVANNAWAAEQALLLDNSAVVFGWLGQCEWRDLKRLQLATKHTQALCWFSTFGAGQAPLH